MEASDSTVYGGTESEVVQLRRLVRESLTLVQKLHWKTKSTIEARRCVEYIERARETLQVRV